MTDRSFGLFEPDALLPAQFYAAFRGGTAVRGEKRLMLAVLQDALDCFQKYAFARDVHGRQLFADAEEWIACDDRHWLLGREHLRDLGDQPRVSASWGAGVEDNKPRCIGPQEPRMKMPVTVDAVLAVAG